MTLRFPVFSMIGTHDLASRKRVTNQYQQKTSGMHAMHRCRSFTGASMTFNSMACLRSTQRPIRMVTVLPHINQLSRITISSSKGETCRSLSRKSLTQLTSSHTFGMGFGRQNDEHRSRVWDGTRRPWAAYRLSRISSLPATPQPSDAVHFYRFPFSQYWQCGRLFGTRLVELQIPTFRAGTDVYPHYSNDVRSALDLSLNTEYNNG